jgi:hypothetical protein
MNRRRGLRCSLLHRALFEWDPLIKTQLRQLQPQEVRRGWHRRELLISAHGRKRCRIDTRSKGKPLLTTALLMTSSTTS